jgi:hypothetical protein
MIKIVNEKYLKLPLTGRSPKFVMSKSGKIGVLTTGLRNGKRVYFYSI